MSKVCSTIQNHFPKIKIFKKTNPIIYLDACILIEMAKYEKGICKNEHVDKIGKLYNTLKYLMLTNRVISPLGNQFEEVGASQNRVNARDFLYRFTNLELLLPHEIKRIQNSIGYSAFCENKKIITLDFEKTINESGFWGESQFKISVFSTYTNDLRRLHFD